MEGKTPVPDRERLRSLAAHQASLAIFLSASLIEEDTAELREGGYHPDTPAAVVYRASWKDELVLRTTLSNLVARVKASGIRKQALILVGDFLNAKEKGRRSRLYDRGFKREC